MSTKSQHTTAADSVENVIGRVSRERFEEILDEGIEGGILLAITLDFAN